MTTKLPPDADTAMPANLAEQKAAFTAEGAPLPGLVATQVPQGQVAAAPPRSGTPPKRRPAKRKAAIRR